MGRRFINLILYPLSSGLGFLVLEAWNHPVFMFPFLLGILYLAYLHHLGQFDFYQILEIGGKGLGLGFSFAKNLVSLLQLPFLIWKEFRHWIALLGSERPAIELFQCESFALTFWLLNVLSAKSEMNRLIRLKVVVVPISIISAFLYFLPQYALLAVLLSAIWFIIALVVGARERRERARAQSALDGHVRRVRDERAQRMDSPAPVPEELIQPVPNRYQMTECMICVEEFSDTMNMRQQALYCGHIFHSECIGGWIRDHNRCPICRQPANAAGNVLVTVF